MCLKPITIRNPTKQIATLGGQPLTLTVRCNKCAECVKAIRAEWMFRAYHHTMSTLNNGGYVYFVTLTYAPEHLPHLSDFVDLSKCPNVHDFSCFNLNHFKDFLKRLRSRIAYNYKIKSGAFDYFLTSEYGVDERFTHRPHYHILLYLKSKLIHPCDFSKLVSECWKYGRTDGLPYEELDYVSGHVYGYDLGFGVNTDLPKLINICNYVAKYITKQSKFESQLKKRIHMLKLNLGDDYTDELLRVINMFHRQSQGFGLSYLSSMDDRKIANLLDMKCVIVDPQSREIIRTAPLSMYYKRKLLYVCRKRQDGTYYWELSDNGLRIKIEAMLRRVDKYAEELTDSLTNMNESQRLILQSYLGSRTINDYALYAIFYKGRLRHSDTYDTTPISDNTLSDLEYNLYDWIDIIKKSSQPSKFTIHDYYPVVDRMNILTYLE